MTMTGEAPRARVLLVEDEPAHAELCQRGLSRAPVDVDVVGDITAARAWLAQRPADLVVSDLRLPDGTALELLAGPGGAAAVPLVVMTSQGDEQHAVDAMKRGALDYVVKSPTMFRELPLIVERALRAAQHIAERTRAETQLRESEARFRQVVDSIQDVFWLYEVARDQIIYVSPAWEAVFGSPAEHAAGAMSNRLAVVVDADRERVERTFRERGCDGPLRQEFRARGAGGAERVIEERTFPIAGPDGQPWRVAGLMTDLTQRRTLEHALQRSHRLEALGQLVGGIAHEFSNMLGSILFASEQLAEELRAEPARRELCEVSIHAAERCNELTRQLMAFGRVGTVAARPLDLNQLVWDTITLLRRSVDQRIMILGDLRASPAVVRGEPSQLQTALLNLGIRARDAMPDGGELTFETDNVVLDELACSSMAFALEPGPYVQVSVRDTGAPITATAREHLFEPFGGGDPGAGASIGLAAVYGTAVAHHGAVTVYSGVDRGSAIHLFVPRPRDGVVVVAPPGPIARGSGRILIVDDEPLLVEALDKVLVGLGYQVLTATDETEAMARFREHQAELSAVICDIMMPGTLGIDIIQQMRALAPDVPIVVSSGYAREQRLAELAPLAISAFLPKPIRRAELAAVLASTSRTRPLA
jgi:PAS domain S-box-containing protein